MALLLEAGSDAAFEERAKASRLRFVRSHTQLALHTEAANGWRLTAYECLEAFGRKTMESLANEGSAIVARKGCEVAGVVRARREALGVGTAALARSAGLAERVVLDVEEGHRTIRIRELQAVAWALALDAVRLGTIPATGASFPARGLFRRARQAGGDVTEGDVLELASAASLAFAELRLARWVGRRAGLPEQPASRPRRPKDVRSAWVEGAELSRQTRALMGLDPVEPVPDLADVVEGRLGIPVVRVRLDGPVAGATLADGRLRGIALNVVAMDANLGARRVTLGHELCHVLCEGDEEMRGIRVETDPQGLDRDPQDPVEARAQAFGSELIAPASAVARVCGAHGSARARVIAVMDRFGVSRTCAARQIANALDSEPDWSSARTVPIQHASARWIGSELLGPDPVRSSRAGRPRSGRAFEICAEAIEANLISHDTAAHVLSADPAVVLEVLRERPPSREHGPRLD